ncbi:uncharacterized protein LOC129974948 [Argiope bruennichi]|uniref:uncharacterized protein LOC129974948 n=1 Tax=Argiope bruennichi TaxID=94029 RepID=UPI002494D2D7|nr:uncharacterized protein LOC129974948 [Argiope bruennichi]
MDYFGQPLSPVSMRRHDAAEAELDELLMNSMRSSDEEEQESQERSLVTAGSERSQGNSTRTKHCSVAGICGCGSCTKDSLFRSVQPFDLDRIKYRTISRRDKALSEIKEFIKKNVTRISDEEEQESQERSLVTEGSEGSQDISTRTGLCLLPGIRRRKPQWRNLGLLVTAPPSLDLSEYKHIDLADTAKNLLSSLPPSQAESELEDINNKSNIQELDLWLRKQMKRNWEEEEKKCRKRSRVTKGSEGSQGNSTRTEPWSTAGSEGSQGNDRIGDKKLDDSTGSDAK